MAPLKGFSDNPLVTREDLVTACYALLAPLGKYQSSEGARIRLPVETGTHFDDIAAQLEGFARPLWAIGALLSAEENSTSGTSTQINPLLLPYINGLHAGTSPASPPSEFWGSVGDKDQRMVEIEILAFALLAAPRSFLGDPSSTSPEVLRRRHDIKTFLMSVNEKEFPQTNWLWFRVLANLALVKSLGVEYGTLREGMEKDLGVLESFYIGGGWAADGEWGEGGKQMDYYAGSFAIQYSQLMYAKYASDIDPQRAAKFIQRARDFSLDFWRYFNVEGAAIPFGRSLTYRFSMGAFWAAVALSEVELPAPLSIGVVKGLLLRHLRWWAKQENAFYPDGTLNIGYCYPNMYMSEDYNSPQSPYWCMKTLVAVGLLSSHTFWTTPEEPHPLSQVAGADRDLSVGLIKSPKQILVDSGNHHFLLSSGQYCGWPLKATQAKYSKFAYSSAFGFSVPTGPLIQQLAPDSALFLSLDEGETWRTRWKSQETRIDVVKFYGSREGDAERKIEELKVLVNRWEVGKKEGVVIETMLIPPVKRWKDWHIRIHRIKSKAASKLLIVEGGFAIYGRRASDGGNLPQRNDLRTMSDEDLSLFSEGLAEDGTSSLIISPAGASGIRQLSSTSGQAKGVILKPDANTNLMVPRTLIPTTQQDVDVDGDRELLFITAVFAVSGRVLDTEEIRRRWLDEPVVFAVSGRVLGTEEIRRRWLDEPVDLVVDVPSESACIGIQI